MVDGEIRVKQECHVNPFWKRRKLLVAAISLVSRVRPLLYAGEKGPRTQIRLLATVVYVFDSFNLVISQ